MALSVNDLRWVAVGVVVAIVAITIALTVPGRQKWWALFPVVCLLVAYYSGRVSSSYRRTFGTRATMEENHALIDALFGQPDRPDLSFLKGGQEGSLQWEIDRRRDEADYMKELDAQFGLDGLEPEIFGDLQTHRAQGYREGEEGPLGTEVGTAMADIQSGDYRYLDSSY